MPSLRKAAFALLLLPPLFAAPARAVGGGTVLPFNDTLSLIADNISGPTANTVVVIVFICGLIGMAVSRENAWMKTLGGIALISALIAKAPAVMTALGLGGATSSPYLFLYAQVIATAILALSAGLVLFPLCHALGELRSPSLTS